MKRRRIMPFIVLLAAIGTFGELKARHHHANGHCDYKNEQTCCHKMYKERHTDNKDETKSTPALSTDSITIK